MTTLKLPVAKQTAASLMSVYTRIMKGCTVRNTSTSYRERHERLSTFLAPDFTRCILGGHQWGVAR